MTFLCHLDDLQPDVLRRFEVDDERLVVVRRGERVFALEDRCSHEEFPLSDGFLQDGHLVCPMHGATFDPETGSPLSLPAYDDLVTYETRIQDGKVYVEL